MRSEVFHERIAAFLETKALGDRANKEAKKIKIRCQDQAPVHYSIDDRFLEAGSLTVVVWTPSASTALPV